MPCLYTLLPRDANGRVIPRRTPQSISLGTIPHITVTMAVEGPTIRPYVTSTESLPSSPVVSEPSSPLLSAASSPLLSAGRSPLPITPERVVHKNVTRLSTESSSVLFYY